jgi:hypothetical protein
MTQIADMTGNLEAPTLDEPPRGDIGHSRIQARSARPLSRRCPATRNGEKADAKSRLRLKPITIPAKAELPKSPMRVLLRNAKTQKFIRAGERWTKDPKLAQDFHNGWWATLHALTMNPRHLVIHYEFDDDRYNLHIPVVGHPRHSEAATAPASTRKSAA